MTVEGFKEGPGSCYVQYFPKIRLQVAFLREPLVGQPLHVVAGQSYGHAYPPNSVSRELVQMLNYEGNVLDKVVTHKVYSY